jgi:glucokinase
MEKTINQVLGIDIGGSHITTGIIDLTTRSFMEGSEIRSQVNAQGSAEDILTRWCDTIKKAFHQFPGSFSKIGIAMPGPFDYEEGVCLIKGFNKYESLYGLNVREMLAMKLSIDGRNIRLRNDAEAFLQGEVFCGAAKGYKRAIGITLGTGLGSARSINGHTEDAELSETPFYDGIAEDYISTRWFIKRCRELTGQEVKDVKTIAHMAQGDESARKVFKEFSRNLALFLNDFIKADNPEVVVIGGNISNAYALFGNELKTNLKDLSDSISIKKAALGELAALIGGACLWEQVKTELQ